MNIRRALLELVETGRRSNAALSENTHLYLDLGYDSLSFMQLLLQIEELFHIRFSLPEMTTCLSLDQLIFLVEQKSAEAQT